MKNNYFLLFIAIVFASCVSQKKSVYVQSANNDKAEYRYSNDTRKNIRIEPFDILYITINSLDQPGYNFFNQEKSSTTALTEATLAVFGYTVNDSGMVNIPLVGGVKLKGLTLDEATKAITNAVKNMLNNPIVSVRFVDNTVTILGEVQHPGTYTYAKEQLSIFRAIGLAGDITEYGNRRKVTLIREKDKTVYKYYLDLTKDDIFKSEFYHLKPNDILYVQPLRVRRWGVKDIKDLPISIVLTAITTYILFQTYINK